MPWYRQSSTFQRLDVVTGSSDRLLHTGRDLLLPQTPERTILASQRPGIWVSKYDAGLRITGNLANVGPDFNALSVLAA